MRSRAWTASSRPERSTCSRGSIRTCTRSPTTSGWSSTCSNSSTCCFPTAPASTCPPPTTYGWCSWPRSRCSTTPSGGWPGSWPTTTSSRPGRRLLAVVAAVGQVAPAGFGDVDVVALGGGQDPLPRLIALGVAHALDLVEPGYRVAHVAGVGQRLLALVGERELVGRQPVLFRGAQALLAAGHILPVGSFGLHLTRLGDVLPGCCLLLIRSHDASSRYRSWPLRWAYPRSAAAIGVLVTGVSAPGARGRRCDVVRLIASTPVQTTTAPAIWIRVGCSASTRYASSIAAAGCSSRISDAIAAGSLGSEEVISSQPSVWLSSASSSSHPNDGQPIRSCRPPKTRPSSSAPSAAPAVTSESGPATCGVLADDRRRISRNTAYATEVPSPYATPASGWVPPPSPPTIPDTSTTPTITTGRKMRNLRSGRSPNSAQAANATNRTCRLPSTVATPAPTSAIAWFHSTRSTARHRPATKAPRRAAAGRGPRLRCSSTASAISTGSASRQR